MAADIQIVQASPEQIPLIHSILAEAAGWLAARGQPLWLPDEISEEQIAASFAEGLTFLAFVDGASAATLRFQLSDPACWPEATEPDSAFVHRLAVRRAFAGTGLASTLLRWSADRARRLGKRYLRLDCEAQRPKLRAFYQAEGFRFHSETHVGPLFLARFEMELT
jgi:GNAT superfamily N-acetyltransferase